MQSQAYKVFLESVDDKKAKQLKKAVKSCLDMLKKAPRDANCMHILGLIESQLGNLPQAKEWLEKSLAIRPESAEVQCHYGLVLMELRKYEEAAAVFLRALQFDENHVEATYHLGNALSELGKPDEAMVAYERAVALKPDNVEALNNLGNLLNEQGRLQEALDCYRRVLAARPDYVMAYNNMGLSFVALSDLDAAEDCYLKALKIRPDYPEALNNLGIVYRMKGRYAESKDTYRRALELRPDYPDALNNLANVQKDSGELQDAIVSYEHSLRLKDSADHRHNLALALLAAGRYEEGWRAYESRWQTRQLGASKRNFQQPQWMGEPAEGKTLLIHSEQGFGDTLQFCRYAPMAKALGMRVIMEVQPAATELLTSLDGVELVISRGQRSPPFDLHCPMMSLPHAFGTKVETIPAKVPYLSANAERVAVWRDRMPASNGALRVGLVWAGSARMQSPDLVATDRRRSMDPKLLAPLLDVPGVQFYSLQKTAPFAPAEFGLIDLMGECGNFAETAALVSNLDLVISVDTAMVHLTGALGKPIWVLNRFDTCWRWFLDREDSPWYPTARVFRQTTPGDWGAVIARVRDALTAIAPNKN